MSIIEHMTAHNIDPSFLDDFDDGDHVKYENKGIDGGGDDDDADFFLWDGEVNEDAHLD